VIVLIMAQLFRTTGIVAVIAGYAGVPLIGLPVPQGFLPLLPPFFDYVLSLGVIPVAIEYHRGTHSGWVLAVAFSIIGLVDALLGELLAIIGFDLFLIPATVWIVTNIALLVILHGPARGRARRET
jgi:hypothetical protein